MFQENLRQVVRIECDQLKIDPKIISAIITVESSWRPKVARYEKNYIYTFKADDYAEKHGITLQTEIGFQKHSWGLMQLMGGTARQIGYTDWVPDLCKPEYGIYWGCMYFKKNCMEYVKVSDQIAAYNAGSVRRKEDGSYKNQEYVDKVMALLDSTYNN